MDLVAYIIKCIVMFLVSWTAIRMIGRKSLANMTAYDLSALFLITTLASGPIIYENPSEASIGIVIIVLITLLIGKLSINNSFYHIDANPLIVVIDGKIQIKALKKAQMNIPLLLSELRARDYQSLSDIKYAIVEPNGKLSVVPTFESRPVTPNDMSIPVSPVFLSLPLIIEGKILNENLTFLQKDQNWLVTQLQYYSVDQLEKVLLAQLDSQGKLYVIQKDKEIV